MLKLLQILKKLQLEKFNFDKTQLQQTQNLEKIQTTMFLRTCIYSRFFDIFHLVGVQLPFFVEFLANINFDLLLFFHW